MLNGCHERQIQDKTTKRGLQTLLVPRLLLRLFLVLGFTKRRRGLSLALRPSLTLCRRDRNSFAFARRMAGMPDELLEELVRVLLFDHDAEGLDDFARVVDKFAAFRRELILVNGRVVFDVLEGLIDLLVGRKPAATEGLDYAKEAKL